MRRTHPHRDIVADLRTLYREMFRDRSLVLSDREVRTIWDANADAPHVVIRECRTLDAMRNAIQRQREAADHQQWVALHLRPGNVTAIAA